MVMIMKLDIYFTFKFKELFSCLLVLCLIISFTFYVVITKNSTAASSNDFVAAIKQLIIIDPGHGGEDGGTVSSKGVNEKIINLQISKKLKNVLEICGYRVLMTRIDDNLIYDDSALTMREKKVSDLYNRFKIAENNPEGLFLSIHQNYFTESKYWGAQVFYSNNNPESLALAENIQNTFRDKLQSDNDRKIKKSGKEIYLLNNIKSPAVMVECGFMSNYSEALKLEDNGYQIKIALVIVDGINKYLCVKGET